MWGGETGSGSHHWRCWSGSSVGTWDRLPGDSEVAGLGVQGLTGLGAGKYHAAGPAYKHSGLGELPRLCPYTLHLPTGKLWVPSSCSLPVHCARPQHPQPEMGLEVAYRAWSCSPCHLGQGAFRSHYRALSQWASYLSALHLHSRFFRLQRTPRATVLNLPDAATL